DREGLGEGGQHVLLAHHAAVEQGQAGQRHQQHQRRGNQHPGDVAGVVVRRLGRLGGGCRFGGGGGFGGRGRGVSRGRSLGGRGSLDGSGGRRGRRLFRPDGGCQAARGSQHQCT